jgi:DNA-binding MarR family transcriptional regulator
MVDSSGEPSGGISASAAPSFSDEGSAYLVGDYRIDDQIGLFIRRAHQRASAIFSAHFADANLSPLQFTTLVKVRDEGRVSQNQLGRLVHTDPATIMGVVNRLSDRNLLRRLPDPNDRRRTMLAITSDGLKLTEELEVAGHAVTSETLAPLEPAERQELYRLLAKIL